jgi:uncharacterized protein GlcG (DUF336 family)
VAPENYPFNQEDFHMRKLTPLLASLIACFSVSAFAAEAPVVVKIPRLTLEAAQRIAQGAVDACRKQGIQIGVTVVDRNGDQMVVLRDTMAPRLTLDVSRQKAYTALSFNAATSGMANRFTQPFSVGKAEGLLFSAGGVPLSAAGNIVGAVGVSGAPAGEQDEACAQEGIKAIAFDLEAAEL